MADEQIFRGAATDGTAEYTAPSNAQFVLKAVNADFVDNGAASDWLPAVVIVSDAGHIIARAADQAVKVVGGDDAEVSWFPGVKNAGAGFAGLPQARVDGPVPAAGIPSGVVTTFQWGNAEFSGGGSLSNSAFQVVANPTHFDFYVTRSYIYVYAVRLEWAASFAGDRYVEIDVASASSMPQRYRVNGTPQGDLMMLAGEFVGGFDLARLVTVNVFQASGAPQDIAALTVEMLAAQGGP